MNTYNIVTNKSVSLLCIILWNQVVVNLSIVLFHHDILDYKIGHMEYLLISK